MSESVVTAQLPHSTPTSGKPPWREPVERRPMGLETQVEIHDRTQIELRLNYSIGTDPGRQLYTVDAYFFIPRNIGLNHSNYSKDQFYGDVTAHVRLDAAPLPLEKLADPECGASPLHRLARDIEALRFSPRPPPSTAVTVHVKLYAYLYTLAMRKELNHLRQMLKDASARSPEMRGRFESELSARLKVMNDALWAYRRQRSRIAPFERLCHDSLPEAMRAADQYMSLDLEERLGLFVASLESDTTQYDGTGFVARCRLLCAALAADEAAYRRHRGYLTLEDSSPMSGEYFTYRTSILKKSVQQALYLNLREVKADTLLRNAVGAVAAALAAIWALATQLPSTLASVSGGAKMLVFTAAVIAYVMKDRIKAMTSETLIKRLRRFDHASSLHGETLATIGLGMLQSRLQETMAFVPVGSVDTQVVELRKSGSSIRAVDVTSEEVIHYRKQLEVGTKAEQQRLPDSYWVRDILRLNVRHFLVRLDDPLDSVAYFDPERNQFGEAKLPKVYHVNLVLRVTRETGGKSQQRLEHLRLMLNKDGIVRVEEGNTYDLHRGGDA